MKYFIICSFLILPFTSSGQSVDSLENQLNKFEKEIQRIEITVDSLEQRKEKLSNKIREFRQLVSRKKVQKELSKGIPTKISSFSGKLRDKPNIDGNIIYELEKGDDVIVYSEYEKPYFKASYKGSIGFISYASLQKNEYIRSIISQDIKENNPKLAYLIKKYGQSTARRLMNGDIWVGMTGEMAKISVGYPQDINKSTYSWGVHEQWVYPDGYLYFENGKLTSWQK